MSAPPLEPAKAGGTSYYALLRVGDIKILLCAQRKSGIDRKRVQVLKEIWRDESCEPITVVRHYTPDGTYVDYVENGAHRCAVLTELRGSDAVVPAIIHEYHGPEDGLCTFAATLFLDGNNSKSISQADKFLVMVSKGDPHAVAARDALAFVGAEVHPHSGLNRIRAGTAVYEACRLFGPEALAQSVIYIREGFGPKQFPGPLVEGLALFHHCAADYISDMSRVIRGLRLDPAGDIKASAQGPIKDYFREAAIYSNYGSRPVRAQKVAYLAVGRYDRTRGRSLPDSVFLCIKNAYRTKK